MREERVDECCLCCCRVCRCVACTCAGACWVAFAAVCLSCVSATMWGLALLSAAAWRDDCLGENGTACGAARTASITVWILVLACAVLPRSAFASGRRMEAIRQSARNTSLLPTLVNVVSDSATQVHAALLATRAGSYHPLVSATHTALVTSRDTAFRNSSVSSSVVPPPAMSHSDPRGARERVLVAPHAEQARLPCREPRDGDGALAGPNIASNEGEEDVVAYENARSRARGPAAVGAVPLMASWSEHPAHTVLLWEYRERQPYVVTAWAPDWPRLCEVLRGTAPPAPTAAAAQEPFFVHAAWGVALNARAGCARTALDAQCAAVDAARRAGASTAHAAACAVPHDDAHGMALLLAACSEAGCCAAEAAARGVAMPTSGVSAAVRDGAHAAARIAWCARNTPPPPRGGLFDAIPWMPARRAEAARLCATLLPHLEAEEPGAAPARAVMLQLSLPMPLTQYTRASLTALADWVCVFTGVEAAWGAARGGDLGAAILALRLSVAVLDMDAFRDLGAVFVATVTAFSAGPLPFPGAMRTASPAGLPASLWLSPFIAAALAREAYAAEPAARPGGAALQRVDADAWDAALAGRAAIPSAWTAPAAVVAVEVLSSIAARVAAYEQRGRPVPAFTRAACGAGTFVGLLAGMAASAGVLPSEVADGTVEPHAAHGARLVREARWL